MAPVVPHRDTEDMAAVDEREYSEIASSLRSRRGENRPSASPSVSNTNNVRPVAIQRPTENHPYVQMEEEEIASSLRSHGKRDSEITRKNAIARRKIAVDVT